ncbi:MAG TPA: hypothetical protein VFQ45_00965 [Longimicrobium sp.]|nr:hypothetical protein [Longimicrobium sp.]
MRALLLAGTAALLGACSLLDEEAYVRYPGALEYYAEPALISVPDSVRVGETFSVNLATYSSDCIERSHTESSQSGLSGWVTPYDINRNLQSKGCGQAMRTHAHTAELRFDKAGTATVRVSGIRVPGQEQIAFQRTVVVY